MSEGVPCQKQKDSDERRNRWNQQRMRRHKCKGDTQEILPEPHKLGTFGDSLHDMRNKRVDIRTWKENKNGQELDMEMTPKITEVRDLPTIIMELSTSTVPSMDMFISNMTMGSLQMSSFHCHNYHNSYYSSWLKSCITHGKGP